MADFEIIIIIFAAALLFLFIFLALSLRRSSRTMEQIQRSQIESKAVTDIQQQTFAQLTRSVNQQLQNMSSQFQRTTGHIGTTLGDVKKDLGKMEAVSREVLEKAKNISNLENLLRAPKFRGGLGELFLGDLLSQILPPAHFTLQYTFKSGETVDAVIRIGHNLVPVDSKFPLENFKKSQTAEEDSLKLAMKKRFRMDVRKHIKDIAGKYILPDENTYDFALMYIPAENIYYETIIRDETLGEERSLFSYATRKRVIPVSPNSFFAYLQVIVLGLKGLQIEKSARDIVQALARLQGDLGRFRKDFQVLGAHLGNARSKYEDAEKRLDRFSDKLEAASGEDIRQLTGGESEPEVQAEDGDGLEG